MEPELTACLLIGRSVFCEQGETAGCGHGSSGDGIYLNLEGCANCMERIPEPDDGKVEREDAERGLQMRAAEVDKGVVQVRFVGIEGGRSAEDSAGHHTQGVADGNRENREGEGDQPEPALVRIRHELRFGRNVGSIDMEHTQDEEGENHAHHQGTAVADEHAQPMPEDVVDEEGDQTADAGYGERSEEGVSDEEEVSTEDGAGHDTVPGGESVDAVDEVDGVDDSDDGDDGEGDADPGGDVEDAPEAVEVVDLVLAEEDDGERGEYFDEEAELWGKPHDVVHGTDVEHEHHEGEEEHELRFGCEGADEAHTEDDGEEDDHAAEDGYGLSLEFAFIGVVGDAL